MNDEVSGYNLSDKEKLSLGIKNEDTETWVKIRRYMEILENMKS